MTIANERIDESDMELDVNTAMFDFSNLSQSSRSGSFRAVTKAFMDFMNMGDYTYLGFYSNLGRSMSILCFYFYFIFFF